MKLEEVIIPTTTTTTTTTCIRLWDSGFEPKRRTRREKEIRKHFLASSVKVRRRGCLSLSLSLNGSSGEGRSCPLSKDARRLRQRCTLIQRERESGNAESSRYNKKKIKSLTDFFALPFIPNRKKALGQDLWQGVTTTRGGMLAGQKIDQKVCKESSFKKFENLRNKWQNI